MLSFELTAIDIILVIAVLVLFVLYWTKLSKIPDEQFFRGLRAKDAIQEKVSSNPQSGYAECPREFGNIRKIKHFFRGIAAKDASQEKVSSNPQSGYAECPRGFGNIRKIDNDGSVSERCLGCYRIMECYGETEEIRSQPSLADKIN
jgi:hypothetical protein